MPDDMDRIMRLLDHVSDDGWAHEEIDSDAAWYHEDQARAYELRALHAIAAGLGAIAMLLARQDDEVRDAWERY